MTVTKKKPMPDTFTFDGLCAAFGLKASRDGLLDLIDRNFDYIVSMFDEIEDEDERMEAQSEIESAFVDAYFGAAESAIEDMAEQWFRLSITKISKEGKEDTYKVKPMKSWEDSLKPIVETMNGVGYFYFRDGKALMRSGPYTAREAVLSHMGYLSDVGSVYEEESLERKFEKNLDHALRYL